MSKNEAKKRNISQVPYSALLFNKEFSRFATERVTGINERKALRNDVFGQISPITKMRVAADLLNKQQKYSESYAIYDEVYRQIMSVFGKAYYQSKTGWTSVASTSVSFSNLSKRQVYVDPTANVLLARQYGIGLSSALDEFISASVGRLQSVCYSRQMSNEIGRDTILSEFIVVYSLVLQPERQRKIAPIFNAVTVTMDTENRLRRIRPNYSAYKAEKVLNEYVQKNSGSNWQNLNRLLLEYLSVTGATHSELYRTTLKSITPFSHRSERHEYRSHWYDRYESSKQYENYFRTKGQSSSQTRTFNPAYATDEEKLVYFGRLFGLQGKVSKSDIRSKYIQSVALYHPDKVQHLGSEIKELAERKTKEFNTAYEWLKKRYKI